MVSEFCLMAASKSNEDSGQRVPGGFSNYYCGTLQSVIIMAMNAQDVVQIFSALDQSKPESQARGDPFVQIYFYFQPRGGAVCKNN